MPTAFLRQHLALPANWQPSNTYTLSILIDDVKVGSGTQRLISSHLRCMGIFDESFLFYPSFSNYAHSVCIGGTEVTGDLGRCSVFCSPISVYHPQQPLCVPKWTGRRNGFPSPISVRSGTTKIHRKCLFRSTILIIIFILSVPYKHALIFMLMLTDFAIVIHFAPTKLFDWPWSKPFYWRTK